MIFRMILNLSRGLGWLASSDFGRNRWSAQVKLGSPGRPLARVSLGLTLGPTLRRLICLIVSPAFGRRSGSGRASATLSGGRRYARFARFDQVRIVFPAFLGRAGSLRSLRSLRCAASADLGRRWTGRRLQAPACGALGQDGTGTVTPFGHQDTEDEGYGSSFPAFLGVLRRFARGLGLTLAPLRSLGAARP